MSDDFILSLEESRERAAQNKQQTIERLQALRDALNQDTEPPTSEDVPPDEQPSNTAQENEDTE